MIKPAGLYLDVIAAIRAGTTLPVAAYQVSGEYAQIQAAARAGWLDLEAARNESLLAIKRAGADIILTYFAKGDGGKFAQFLIWKRVDFLTELTEFTELMSYPVLP